MPGEAWFDHYPVRDNVAALIEDLDERQAIADLNPAQRSLTDLDALEAKARQVRPERATGAHWCARVLLQVDIPRWRARHIATAKRWELIP